VQHEEGRRWRRQKVGPLDEAWKYYNYVPMSSFYLEMRAA